MTPDKAKAIAARLQALKLAVDGVREEVASESQTLTYILIDMETKVEHMIQDLMEHAKAEETVHAGL